MKFAPVTCVRGRRMVTFLTASYGLSLYAIMAYAAVHVPARWAPARQWISTFPPPSSELSTKRYNRSKAKQYRAIADHGGHEAAPLWCARLPVPGKGWDVASNIDYQRDVDLGEVREVIGA